MYKLTRKDNGILILFKWTERRQKTFNKIKKKMIITLMIAYSDFEKLFILYIDALRGDIGVVLY